MSRCFDLKIICWFRSKKKKLLFSLGGIFLLYVNVLMQVKVYLPSGVWVVWSVSGPRKPPLASTQSCPSSLWTLSQLHCPDSKSQLPGGRQAPSLKETSSTFTVALVPGIRMVCNTTWLKTQAVFQTDRDKQEHYSLIDLQLKNGVWQFCYLEFSRRRHSDFGNLPA